MSKNIGIVVGIGFFSVIIDKVGLPVPNPPNWLVMWTGWIAAVLGLISAPSFFRELIKSLKQKNT